MKEEKRDSIAPLFDGTPLMFFWRMYWCVIQQAWATWRRPVQLTSFIGVIMCWINYAYPNFIGTIISNLAVGVVCVIVVWRVRVRIEALKTKVTVTGENASPNPIASPAGSPRHKDSRQQSRPASSQSSPAGMRPVDCDGCSHPSGEVRNVTYAPRAGDALVTQRLCAACATALEDGGAVVEEVEEPTPVGVESE